MQITKNFWDLANFLLVFVHRFYFKYKKKEYRQIRQQRGEGKEKILIYGRDLKSWKTFQQYQRKRMTKTFLSTTASYAKGFPPIEATGPCVWPFGNWELGVDPATYAKPP